MSKYEIKIIRTYSVRIDFEADIDDLCKIEEKAFKWSSKKPILEVECFHGNACCSPYIEASSSSMEEISEWAGKIIRYANRFKSVRFL